MYRARDPELDRDVALKLLDFFAEDHGSKAGERRARMTREAQAMARLSHPNVVTVHDVGEHDDSIFIAMEFIEGMTLSRWLSLHGPPVEAIVDAFVRAGRGLIAAHEAALVHRDFKPDNVMVELRPGTGEVARLVVMDFGLARGTGESSEPVDPSGGTSTLDANLTATGGAMGTPAYMSPEQHTHGDVGPASDQFSFCVSLYEALYHQRPFAGDGAMAIAFAAIEGKIRPTPKRDDVPAWLERAVLRGLGSLPERRWPSMAALVSELSRDRGRGKRIALLGIVAAAAGAFAWSQGRQPDPCEGATEEIDAVWNADAGDRIETAFESSEVPGAEHLYKALQVELDAYASNWKTARLEACRDAAEEEPEVSTRRRRCLDGCLQHFAATVGVLSDPDEEAIRRSASVGPKLLRIGVCSNETFLSADVEPPPEEIADRVDELRAERNRIQARIQLGQLANAEHVAEAAVLEARALGYVPLVAELTYTFGEAENELGKLDDAATLWEEAYLTASGVGYYRLAAEAAVALGHYYAVDKQELEAAKQWVEHGRALVERSGEPTRLNRMLRSVEATIAWAEGRYEDAVDAGKEALALAEVIDGRRSPEVARLAVDLALYEANAGRPTDALPRVAEAIGVLEGVYGPEHPQVADALLNQGLVQARAGEPDASLETYQRALEIRERATPGHSAIATLVQNIAINYAERGDNGKALPMFERVLELRTEALDDRHPLVGSAHLNLAASLKLADRYGDAVEHLMTALDIISLTQGPESSSAGIAHFELGGNRRLLGDAEGALTHLETARDIFAKALGENHPHMVMAHAGVAQILVELGRLDEAFAGFEKALEVAAHADVRPMDVAQVQVEYTTLLLEHERIDPREAMAIVRKAMESLPKGTPLQEEAAEWLATVESEAL